MKVREIIISIMIIGGLLYLIGTVGASDQELISNTRLLIQSLIGLLIMATGFILMEVTEK